MRNQFDENIFRENDFTKNKKKPCRFLILIKTLKYFLHFSLDSGVSFTESNCRKCC